MATGDTFSVNVRKQHILPFLRNILTVIKKKTILCLEKLDVAVFITPQQTAEVLQTDARTMETRGGRIWQIKNTRPLLRQCDVMP